MRSRIYAAVLASTIVSFVHPAAAATWGELTSGNTNGASQGSYAVGPYAVPPQQSGNCWGCGPVAPHYGGPEGMPPSPLDAPGIATLPPALLMSPDAFLPMTRDAHLPVGQTQLWTFGQMNNTTDPYDQAGLSTPFMYVPWSTPLSGWTNAQTWNWWRERAGVRSPLW
ncbi:hypothetical protein [Pinisolibacter sp.]|uniref:hypothetical protein n=1 Tax=Pinisolibacter sp. TaxID=2172024 RepID=UPI002FDEAD60